MAVVAALLVTVLMGLLGVGWLDAAVIGWVVASIVYTGWVWLTIGGLDATRTAEHASREDPSRAASDLLLIVASIASLAALVFILAQAQASSAGPRFFLATVGVSSIVTSWFLIHTLHTLKYAAMHYGHKGGAVDFNQDDPPCYADFAYLSFTIGMTFQVSDPRLQTPAIRAAVLRHGLLSYLFGTVILASTINLVAGLGK